MKQERDMNRLRNILLFIKENVRPGGEISKPVPEIDMYHLHLLVDAGFIQCNIKPFKGGYLISKVYINNAGHDFYDSIKDKEVWNKVEEEVEKKDRKISDIALPVLINIAYKIGETFYESNS